MPLRITLGQLLHDCAARFGERPCITMAPSGETISYGGLESLVNLAGHGFWDRIAAGLLGAASGHVAILEQMPRTVTGKPEKGKLAELPV